MKRKGARLGQHFLKNPHYAKMLAEAAGAKLGETLLEIGPGTGALTKEILATGAHVIAIEKDEVLACDLENIFPTEIREGRLRVVSGDVRDFKPENHGLSAGAYILAANIPYYITGEIIRMFLETETQPKAMALLIQKEVADRIISEKESILSLSVKVYGTPKIIARVSRGNFSPPPSVDSAILLIANISKKNFVSVNEQKFFEVVRAGFASKRKMLANNLSVKFGKEKAQGAFSALKLDVKTRAENLPLSEWLSLAKILSGEN